MRMPLPRLHLLAATALLLGASLSVLADDDTPLTLRLVSEVTSIQPGHPFYVGLALHHGQGWHSYWQFPGVVGVPTNIKWKDLPAGFKADPITWPEPQSVRMFQIQAQGYERDVVLPILITPPASLKEGTRITLAGQASYMCCNRECHPGFEDLSLTLPVETTPQPVLNQEWHDKIHAELASRPRTSSTWSATATEGEDKIVLTLKPNAGAHAITPGEAAKIIYFTEDGLVDSDKPQKIERLDDGSLRFTLVKTGYIVGPKPTQVTGVLLCPPGWLADGTLRSLRSLRVQAALVPVTAGTQ